MKSKVETLKSESGAKIQRPISNLRTRRDAHSRAFRRWTLGFGLWTLKLSTLLLGLWTLDFGLSSSQAQTIEFINSAPSVYEDGTNVSVVVTRTPATGVSTVDYSTADGTATAGFDYQFTSGTLTFNDGESFQIITIPIIDDNIPELTETF